MCLLLWRTGHELSEIPEVQASGVEWLGDVPEHWRTVPLKTVATHNDDVLDEHTSPDEEIVYVDISGVDGANGITSKVTMLFADAPSRARRRVKHGDVIVSTVRTYLRAAYLPEIIKKVNELFEGELTEQDKLVYVNNVITGKLPESAALKQQATNNTKEQFANSPDLKTEIRNAVMSALEAHTTMSTQALNSATVREGLKDVLLGPAQLHETLRA
jgi:hypothetical protein